LLRGQASGAGAGVSAGGHGDGVRPRCAGGRRRGAYGAVPPPGAADREAHQAQAAGGGGYRPHDPEHRLCGGGGSSPGGGNGPGAEPRPEPPAAGKGYCPLPAGPVPGLCSGSPPGAAGRGRRNFSIKKTAPPGGMLFPSGRDFARKNGRIADI